MHHLDPGRSRRVRRTLPRLADVREVALPLRRRLVRDRGAGVAVEAHRRGGHEDPRLLVQL
ncbi:MAG: hypothetical protein ACK559_15430, partial [bacterium]